MSSFKQRRLHLDAFDATQLAREGTNLIGGAFENDGNDAVITTGKALAADDDACVECPPDQMIMIPATALMSTLCLHLSVVRLDLTSLNLSICGGKITENFDYS